MWQQRNRADVSGSAPCELLDRSVDRGAPLQEHRVLSKEGVHRLWRVGIDLSKAKPADSPKRS